MIAPDFRLVCVIVPTDCTEDVADTIDHVRASAGVLGCSFAALIVGSAIRIVQEWDSCRIGANPTIFVSGPTQNAPLQSVQISSLIKQALDSGLLGSIHRTLFVLNAGELGDEVAARLAASLDGSCLGRCEAIDVLDEGVVVRRSMLGGLVEATLSSEHWPSFISIQRDATSRPEESRLTTLASTSVVSVSFDLPEGDDIQATPLEEGPTIESAQLIVAGGRGIGSSEGFTLLKQLADALRGALGGSLPAIDAGWTSVTRQIGQSGKHVQPKIYLAIGISGTPQHIAGIGARSKIVAINKDPDAAIFDVADIGIIDDWQQIVPRLIDEFS